MTNGLSGVLVLALTGLADARSWTAPAGPPADAPGQFAFSPPGLTQYDLGGVVGERLRVNIQNWLLCAPDANPGMLEMFRVRDREPAPNLVPWAGEFVGKYLLSAIPVLRLTNHATLSNYVAGVVADLIATQAEDGYLGPFPKAARLKGNWDLWGHYHCIQALLLWHEFTGDTAALAACRRAGDLVCRTFLDSGMRVFDAGSHEMNMAIIHGLGQLYRRTRDPRYLRMMREIEKDWERAGDYLRTGLAGVEFFQTPRPRWESLHDVQGLLELFRITGERAYCTAFEHHWRSIARWDRHNTGGFSSGEQATGNPYSPHAIETCCTIAWMVLTADQLAVTGDPLAADELELSLFNGGLGAQHPSGRWWTYNTPMDGAREASAHSIVFQARAGTPELNCCSVNGPRALGMLADWAVLIATNELLLNYYGAGRFTGRFPDGTGFSFRQVTDYPRAGTITLTLEAAPAHEFLLKLRIPAWSSNTRIHLNGAAVANVRPGKYLELKRRWQAGDNLQLELDMGLRSVSGEREARGKVSIYRGPLLLAYDQRFNPFDEPNIPALDGGLIAERMSAGTYSLAERTSPLDPWVVLDVPAAGGRAVRLCDFASAGATGTRYRSWLPAVNSTPPPPVTRLPADGGSIGQGRTWFKWTTRTNAALEGYRLDLAEDPEFAVLKFSVPNLRSNRWLMDTATLHDLRPDQPYYWRVVAFNAFGRTASARPPSRFQFDPRLQAGELSQESPEGPGQLLVHDLLRGAAQPMYGALREPLRGYTAATGPNGQSGGAAALNGENQMLVYRLNEFPEEDYSLSVWVRITHLPAHRLGQIFSCWTAGMDDPLRVCVENGKIFARLEAQHAFSTKGAVIKPERWVHVAAVKAGNQLALYLDGQPAGSVEVPIYISTNSREIALGGNPRYSGNEFLAAQFADFHFYGRALTGEEINAKTR